MLASDAYRWRKANWREFGPRGSVAWKASDKVVLRAGYALLYDTLPSQSQIYQNGLNSWPFSGGFRNILNASGTAPVYIESLQGSFPKPLPAADPWSSADWFSAPDRQDAYSHQ